MCDSRSISSFVFCFFSLTEQPFTYSLWSFLFESTRRLGLFCFVFRFLFAHSRTAQERCCSLTLPLPLPFRSVAFSIIRSFLFFTFSIYTACDSDYTWNQVYAIHLNNVWNGCVRFFFFFTFAFTAWIFIPDERNFSFVLFLIFIRLSLVCHFCLFKASHHNRRAYEIYIYVSRL